MSAPTIETATGVRGRWAWLAFLVLVLQVLLVFWLSDNRPIRPRRPEAAPVLQISGPGSVELRALLDPTLFALPHAQSFAGMAWMGYTRIESRPYEYVEEPRWLKLDPSRLGLTVSHLNQSLQFPPTLVSRPGPLYYLPPAEPSLLPNQSAWTIHGPLASRRLLTPLQLPSIAYAEVLTNTVLQLVVQPNGQLFSYALLASSGLKAADDAAAQLARQARFEPLPGAEGLSGKADSIRDLVWGTITFEWHTQPLPDTNAPALVNPR